MEVPAILNLPTGDSAGLKAKKSTGSSERGFSDHLNSNVNRIKSERNELSSRSSKKPDRVETERSAGSKDVEKPTGQGKGDTKKVSATEKASAKDDVSVEHSSSSSAETSVSADKRQLGKGVSEVMSGNELPQAEYISEEISSQLNDSDKAITFDPLSQMKESSANIAALAAGSLPTGDKTRFNGKSNTADLFNPSNLGLSLDKSDFSGKSDIVLDRLQKPLGEMNLVGSLAKELGSSKIPVDGTQFNTTLLTAGTQQNTLLTAAVDKPTLQLDTPMSNPRWGENFNQKVQWVVSQSMSGAQIRLNPQHMGPIEVRIQMQNDQATVSFTAQHGATREAIDAALPRLREMFSEQNVNVGNIDVSQHSFAEQRDQQAANDGEGKGEFFDNLDRDDDSVLGQHADEEQRKYSGLFSDFA